MPEIKNTFAAGKMNKDFDERLIPKGEYRDALNIDLATSEGSNVGVIENSYGNSVITSMVGSPGEFTCVGSVKYGREDKIYWLVAGKFTTSQNKDAIIEYDIPNNRISAVLVDVYFQAISATAHTPGTDILRVGTTYIKNVRVGMEVGWTSSVSGTATVAAVNYATGDITLSATVADEITGVIGFEADRVLKFDHGLGGTYSSGKIVYITGINVLDGLLLWTDNVTEPKKIHIKRCKNATKKSGNGYYNLHTYLEIDGEEIGAIEEKHITSIKRYPLNAPKILMDDAEEGGVIDSATSTPAKFFTYLSELGGVIDPVPPGTNVDTVVYYPNGEIVYDWDSDSEVELKLPSALTFQPSPDWVAGDTIRLTVTVDEDGNDLSEPVEVRLLLTEQTAFDPDSKTFKCSVVSISSNITSLSSSDPTTWQAILEQKDPFYELKFPRFAYRWKYVDGEYSAISPWTNVAFLPDEINGFDYEAKNGYNLAMTNNVRMLTMSEFDTKPDDVVEVDILYKDSISTNMYVVETLKPEYEGWTKNTEEFTIKSEQIHSLLPSIQSLRPYDNVPRTAKAQEITGNRLIYGNYTQQFNIVPSAEPKFDILPTTTEGELDIPSASLKSIRSYKIGVVFLDKYGRQTPVLSNDKATFVIPQKNAKFINTVQAKITTAAPDWATHFKYYIKEPSDYYYNLAMDKWYPSQDGNVWISFPSSERNKLSTDDYVILKKSQGGSIPVEETATVKYKVLAVQNTAPAFIKIQKESIGTISTNFGRGGDWTNGVPTNGYSTVVISGKNIGQSVLQDIASVDTNDKYFRIKTLGGNVSAWYPVAGVNRYDLNDNGEYFHENDYYVIMTGESFGADVNFVAPGAMTSGNETQGKAIGLQFEWAMEVNKDSSEFAGRFFAKINRDSILESYVLNQNNNQENWQVVTEVKLYHFTGSTRNGNVRSAPTSWTQDGTSGYTDTRDDYGGEMVFGIDDAASLWDFPASTDNNDTRDKHIGGLGAARGSAKLHIRLIDFGPFEKNDEWHPITAGRFKTSVGGTVDQLQAAHSAFTTPGTQFWFRDEPNVDGTDRSPVYTINSLQRIYCNNWDRNDHYLGFTMNNRRRARQFKWPSNHGLRYELLLDMPLSWDPTQDGDFGGVTPFGPDYEAYHGADDPRNGSQTYPLTHWAYREDQRKSYTWLDIVQPDMSIMSDGQTTAFVENPAIFETEPDEVPDLNLYYETEDTYPIADLGDYQTLSYYNCFTFCNGVESNRIRDDYNAITIDKGPRVSTELAEQYKEEHKFSGMIYSGIYNSTSGVNRLNEFIQAEVITKDLNPAYGGIQKLHTRQTNILAFCEDKVAKILVSKDALYTASGSAQLTATNKVLGQTIIPDTFGKYGISTNPESFATYGYRMYFTDKNRNAVLRLSGDGVEEISRYGMSDYFNDAFSDNATGSLIIGSYDEDKGNYNLTLNSDTISFTELVRGWTSRKSFIPESGISLNGTYYTFKTGDLWKHNKNTTRTDFYDANTNPGSSIKLIFNDGASEIKNFKTLNYEGSQSKIIEHEGHDSDSGTGIVGRYDNESASPGWYNTSIETDQQSGHVTEFINKEGKWFNYIKGVTVLGTGIDIQEFTSQGIGNISDDGGSIGGGGAVQTGFDITITVNNTTSDNQIQTLSGVVLSNKIGGSSISENVVFTIKPNTGYTVTAGDFAFVSETSSTVADAMGTATFAQSGDDVTMTVPLSLTMPGNNQTVQVNITGTAVLKTYSIGGTNRVVKDNGVVETTVPSGQATSFSGASKVSTTGALLFTKQFVAPANHKFKSDPKKMVSLINTKTPSNYEISVVENTGTYAGGNLTDATITIKYKHPELDISNDTLDWVVRLKENVTASTGKIYDYQIPDTSINYFGEHRKLKLFGDPSATVKLDVYNNATSATLIGSDLEVGTSYLTSSITTPVSSGANDNTYTGVIGTTTGFTTSGNGVGTIAVVVSGGAVTRVDVTANGNSEWYVGNTITVSNSVIGGSTSLVITLVAGDFVPRTVTIGSNGTYTKEIFFPGNKGGDTIVYNIVLTETAGDSFQFNSGNSPKTISLNQYQEGQITFGVSRTSTTNMTFPTNTTIFTGRPYSDPIEDTNYFNPVVSWVVTSSKFWRTPVTPTASQITGASIANDIATLTNGGQVQPDINVVIDNSGGTKSATISGDYLVHFIGTSDDVATLNLDTIIALNTAPVTTSQTYAGTENTTLNIALSTHATDADSDAMTYTLVADSTGSNGALGAITSSTGAVAFVPTSTFIGSTTFTWKASDSLEDGNTSTATITIAPGTSTCYRVDTYNVGGFATGTHYIHPTQTCDGSSYVTTCMSFGSLTNKYIRLSSSAEGCDGSHSMVGKITGATNSQVPTAFAHGNTFYNNNDDGHSGSNGTTC